MKNLEDKTDRDFVDRLSHSMLRKEMRTAGISFRAQDEARHDVGTLVLMVDLFCAVIETGVLPTPGSPCHRMARSIVESSGMKPKRKRRRLPNAEVSQPEGAKKL